MTREEKISRLNDILAEINESEDAVCYLTSEDNELIKSAVEALKHESALHKRCFAITGGFFCRHCMIGNCEYKR